MPSPTITDKLKSFANKIAGVSYVDNGADPDSALSIARRKASMKATPMQSAKAGAVGKNSNGVGVGP